MKATRATAVAVVAMLALAGCSSDEDSSSASTSSSGTAAAGGDYTLRLPLSSAPSDLAVGGAVTGDTTLFLSIYDTVVTLDDEGAVAPGLAESWTYDDTRTSLAFTIRDGLSFSDGAAVDAAAVAASLNATKDGPLRLGGGDITSIEATDDSTVTLTLAAPDAALLVQLGGLKGAVASPASLGSADATLEPVGSGPYVLDQAGTTPGAKYVLKRNEDNWDVESYPFSTVEMTVLADPTAAQNALRAGQIDYLSVSSKDLTTQFDAANFTTGIGKPSTVAALWLVDREGTIVPELADVRVRQAINLALDRETIAAKLNPGTNTATVQVVSPNGEAFDEGLNELYPYDPEAARALLADAGYADGFSVTMPSTALTSPYESVVAQALGDIGITVVWETVPFNEVFAKMAGGNYGMFFMYNGLNSNDAQDISSTFEGLNNPFASMTPELQGLLDTANAAVEADQGEAFAAVNTYLVEQAWFAPVSFVSGFYVVSNDVVYTPPLVAAQGVRAFAPGASS